MKSLFNKFIAKSKNVDSMEGKEEQLAKQVAALYSLLASIYGTDRLVMKAGKVDALHLMRSENLAERVLGLERLTFDSPSLERLPVPEEIPGILARVEEELADLLARKAVEERIERRVSEKMQERHEEYLQEIRMQVLKENQGPETGATLKKLEELEALEKKRLARSAMEMLRPAEITEIVGQDQAVAALVAKLASPFPQHIILYGPPGVGKTTAARLALEAAKKLASSPFQADAPFVEVDGTTLRWDPREVTNPLLGSVHDPIYQGARRDLAESAVPEPKLGLVTEAHGGVLFIDEVGELDPLLQNKLLKVLEDKRVHFDSSYYDPNDPGVPQYIRKIFEEGAPADFILIGATTRDPSQINPALRSRCAEIFFEPLTPAHIISIVENAARKLQVELAPGVAEAIAQYTIEGRKAINLLADAYAMVLYRQGGQQGERVVISLEDIYEMARISRLTPFVQVKAKATGEVGRVFGLGVAGFVGSVLEIEAAAFPARKPGEGVIRFNETAGSMARDSVFNAAAVLRRLTGDDLHNYDLHVNVVGGGNIDGPSAGAAIFLAIYSAITGRPIWQDRALTGEISIQGKIKPVGGIPEKIYGARQAGMKMVLVPKENEKDIPAAVPDCQVRAVETIEEVIELMCVLQ